MVVDMKNALSGLIGLLAIIGGSVAPALAADRPSAMPRYKHIFVIVEENKGYDQIMNHPDWTPAIHRLASEYGAATQFFGEVHASEANYIAMLGGDTFGIHDDDAFYCKPAIADQFCEDSRNQGYADHNLIAPSLMDQLTARGMTWKAYMEDIPSAGSLVPRWPTSAYPEVGSPTELYAAKHNGFINFKNINEEPYPKLAQHFVGFGQLDRDLANDTMPSYAHIVANQCNEMHGLGDDNGPGVPDDCNSSNISALIKRGDAEVGMLVNKILASKLWRDLGNSAIVVTFDENNKEARASGLQGCCGYDPKSQANFGGGHIVTIVITNHGPRHVSDPTPYNHYSLLRTTEAAFGIYDYLGHADDSDKGVATMTPLFQVGH